MNCPHPYKFLIRIKKRTLHSETALQCIRCGATGHWVIPKEIKILTEKEMIAKIRMEKMETMKAVHKYPLKTDTDFIQLPINAKILDIQLQNGVPCVWALVTLEQVALENRKIILVATGQPMPLAADNLKYLKTLQFKEGILVYHLFEVLR